MGLSAPVSALGKRWTLLKAMKRKLGLQDFPVSHTSGFYPSRDVFRCLAELFSWPHRHQTHVKWPDYFSLRNSACRATAPPMPCCCCVGLQTALYYPWLTSRWANCANAASVLCSACGSSSTLLCSVLTARAAVPSQRCIQIPSFLPLTLQLNC